MYKILESTLNWAEQYLKSHAVSNPHIDATSILSHILGCERAELLMKDSSFDEHLVSKFKHLIYLRGSRRPLQYIIGSVNFMGLEFKVRPGVFIPRPETELLVEATLNTIHERRTTNDDPCILDLGTGCGNIAISLAKFSKVNKILASDVSNEAIKVARENIRLHNCESIRLIESDLFGNIDEKGIDIIVSNPPYVSKKDFEKLMPELLYEPSSSLYGGKDGLEFYRSIFKKAPPFLKKDGLLILEIGYNQAEPIKEILDSQKLLLQEIIKDYNDIDRVIVIKKHG